MLSGFKDVVMGRLLVLWWEALEEWMFMVCDNVAVVAVSGYSVMHCSLAERSPGWNKGVVKRLNGGWS